MQSESCPYYTRREFNVTNFKIKDTIKVTQFQYNGWPTVEGEVPEVSRGMLELVDQTLALHENSTYASACPIVVHCRWIAFLFGILYLMEITEIEFKFGFVMKLLRKFLSKSERYGLIYILKKFIRYFQFGYRSKLNIRDTVHFGTTASFREKSRCLYDCAKVTYST